MVFYVAGLLSDRGIIDRGVVVHADLGRMEWPRTKEIAAEQARIAGLRFVARKRPQGDLLEHVERLGKWPMPTQRFCTADHKRGQILVVMGALAAEDRRRRGVRPSAPELEHVMTTHATPMITAAQLVAFMAGSPVYRLGVLERAKYDYLAGGSHVPARALAVRLMLGRIDFDAFAQESAQLLGADLLLTFGRGWAETPCPHEVQPVRRDTVLDVGGVAVTGAAPDVLLMSEGLGGLQRYGGLMLAFEPLTERQAQLRVMLMHAALERLMGPESYTHPDACSVLDLVAGRTHKGSRTRWRDIEAACDEIRRWWATV